MFDRSVFLLHAARLNHVIAYQLLTSELASYRDLGYEQLLAFVGEKSSFRKRAADGNEYEVSIRVAKSFEKEGVLRVLGMVGPTDWGSPHDSVDDVIVVSCSKEE